MIKGRHENVPEFTGAEQRSSNHGAGGKVEWTRRLVRQRLAYRCFSRAAEVAHIQRSAVLRRDLLERHAVARDVSGAQNLVTGNDGVQSLLQGAGIERAPNLHRGADVVAGAVVLKFGNEP